MSSGRLAGSASEVGQVLAAVAPTLPESALRDLRELLAYRLSVPTSGQVREARLGLLTELVAAKQGEVPETREYDDLRRRRKAEDGEEWPSSSTLSRLYGHWLKAVEQAARLYFVGGSARVPASHHHTGRRGSYSRQEVERAIEIFYREFGDWPTEWEFGEWRILARRLARQAGKPMPRIPGLKQVRKLYGNDFDRAVEVTRRAVET